MIVFCFYRKRSGTYVLSSRNVDVYKRQPLREEHEPSFKVNTDRNLWYDFGAGNGGNIIALAKELYCSGSLPYLLNRIAEQTQMCIRDRVKSLL